MYEKFYHLRQKPFTLLPDPTFLYLSEKHGTAAALLEYGLVSQAGIAVITGGIGCGKTTLVQHLFTHMRTDLTVGLLTNTHAAFGDLLDQVLLTFGVALGGRTKAENYHAFVQFLNKQLQEGKHAVLIVDEAQNMQVSVLEQLRLLTNVNGGRNLLLQLILVGQPQLWTRLRDPALEQLVQRISIDYVLEPLNEEEIGHYIRHRLQIAGTDEQLFDLDAVRVVAENSRGIPRLINMLCDQALVYGYAKQVRRIDGPLLRQVVTDRAKGGLFKRDAKAANVSPNDNAVEAAHDVTRSRNERENTTGTLYQDDPPTETSNSIMPTADSCTESESGDAGRSVPADPISLCEDTSGKETATNHGVTSLPPRSGPETGFYLEAGYAAVVQHLHEDLLSGVGVAVLAARSGMGKTMVLRRLAEADYASLQCLLPYSGFEAYTQILRAACEQFRIGQTDAPEQKMETALLRYARDQAERGCRLALLVDSAHQLRSSERQKLISLVLRGHDLASGLQLVLAGTPALRHWVAEAIGHHRTSLKPLILEIEPMDRDQSNHFLRWHLSRSGTMACSFARGSVSRISRYAGGVPQILKTLCRCCCGFAKSSGRNEVTMEIVDTVAKELSLHPRQSLGMNAPRARWA